MRSILLLPLVARCLETIYVCIWRMFDFMSVVVSRYNGYSIVVLRSRRTPCHHPRRGGRPDGGLQSG